MKSTDKFVLVLVASLALLLAGCGGGSSSSTGDDDMDMDMSGPQKTALMNAHTALQGAVNALVGEATQDEVNTAKTAATALQNAINAATDVADSDLVMYRNALTNANNAIGTAQNLLTTQGNKEMTAMAKALKAAIDISKLQSDGSTPVAALGFDPTSIPALDADGDATTADDDTAAITLKKGASVGSLEGWSGTDYAGEAGTGDDKTTGMTRVYTNQETATSIRFDTEAGEAIHGLSRANTAASGDYTLVAGTLDPASADPEVSTDITGFPTIGTTDYEEDDTVTGTYMGAAGTYKCVAAACAANAEGTAGTDLGTGWTFTPASGALLQRADARYLRFGWWLRKDKDGPTHAGAFYGVVTPTDTPLAAATIINSDALVGKASYSGAAAGKFAISDPLRAGHDNSGHFTANAQLEADFKATGSTLSGTINAFRLNDGSDDPGWSVELQKTVWDGTNRFITNDTQDDDQTVWSINGAKGGASGAWEAQMFDEDTEDSSNVPTSVVGSFESSISTTHSLVGAFGAEKD